jgi:hypothetical protein
VQWPSNVAATQLAIGASCLGLSEVTGELGEGIITRPKRLEAVKNSPRQLKRGHLTATKEPRQHRDGIEEKRGIAHVALALAILAPEVGHWD